MRQKAFVVYRYRHSGLSSVAFILQNNKPSRNVPEKQTCFSQMSFTVLPGKIVAVNLSAAVGRSLAELFDFSSWVVRYIRQSPIIFVCYLLLLLLMSISPHVNLSFFLVYCSLCSHFVPTGNAGCLHHAEVFTATVSPVVVRGIKSPVAPRELCSPATQAAGRTSSRPQ